jgi:hypothetical protein
LADYVEIGVAGHVALGRHGERVGAEGEDADRRSDQRQVEPAERALEEPFLVAPPKRARVRLAASQRAGAAAGGARAWRGAGDHS